MAFKLECQPIKHQMVKKVNCEDFTCVQSKSIKIKIQFAECHKNCLNLKLKATPSKIKINTKSIRNRKRKVQLQNQNLQTEHTENLSLFIIFMTKSYWFRQAVVA